MEKITDGYHYLTGIGETWIHDDYSDEDMHGIIVQIDGENYVAYEDPDDGYRSYGRFHKTDIAPKTIFPRQRVYIFTEEIDTYDEDDFPVRLSILRIHRYGYGREIILEIGTDHSDTYYPVAIFHWHPENLPINLSKNG